MNAVSRKKDWRLSLYPELRDINQADRRAALRHARKHAFLEWPVIAVGLVWGGFFFGYFTVRRMGIDADLLAAGSIVGAIMWTEIFRGFVREHLRESKFNF